ncbi:MAG: J domain-containing protein [Deltaproteobacteria bacterium]|nr:J domain-containing protein [Deltaproteobacteria bacterium]
MDQKDYYETLQVPELATQAQIKAAYRKRAFEYHPDRRKGKEDAAGMMKDINEAYAVLSNLDKRRTYDAMRRQYGDSAAGEFRKSYSQQDIFRDSDIHQIFEEVARSFGLRGFEEIFQEFYGDNYRTIRVDRPGVFIRGFVFSGWIGNPGNVFRKLLSGRGFRGLPRLIFESLSGARLPRTGNDIQDTISLTPAQATSGGPYAYFHRKQSKKLIVKIPAGISNGQKIRLTAMGEPGVGGATPGDLYLRVIIKRPVIEKIKAFIGDKGSRRKA